MKKIKEVDGTIVEVEDDYILQEGEVEAFEGEQTVPTPNIDEEIPPENPIDPVE